MNTLQQTDKQRKMRRYKEIGYNGPRISHYSLLITHYSLLITHYSLLITHYSLLITQHRLDLPMLSFTLPIALLLCILGIFLLIWGRRKQSTSGLPAGEVIYSDTGDWQEPEKPLLSRRYGLVGRPDYLVRTVEDGESVTIPVEVKSRRRPATPHASHILQLATYCLLVEDQLKERPPYGLLRYADATLRIPYTEELRQQVLTAAEEIRAAREARNISRQHDESNRCRACGYRTACGPERLV
jgi:CRISPR-associated exonuclease Cas4